MNQMHIEGGLGIVMNQPIPHGSLGFYVSNMEDLVVEPHANPRKTWADYIARGRE